VACSSPRPRPRGPPSSPPRALPAPSQSRPPRLRWQPPMSLPSLPWRTTSRLPRPRWPPTGRGVSGRRRHEQGGPARDNGEAYVRHERLRAPSQPPCTTAPAHTSPLVSDHTRVSHAHVRPLHPAALSFVPYGVVLVRSFEFTKSPAARCRPWVVIYLLGLMSDPEAGLGFRPKTMLSELKQKTNEK